MTQPKPVTAAFLTDAAVSKFKPGTKRREIRDLGAISLYLIIEPTGHRAFAMRFARPGGRAAKLTLGPFDRAAEPKEQPALATVGAPLTLASARALAALVHRERALGRDVIADLQELRRKAKEVAAAVVTDSFESAVRSYVEEHARPNLRHWRVIARQLGLAYAADGTGPVRIPAGLCERKGWTELAKIDARAIRELVEEIRTRGVPGLPRKPTGRPTPAQARVVAARLVALFGWLHTWLRIPTNPCAAYKLPAAEKSRDRVLDNGELVRVWRAAEALGSPVCQVIRLLVLTGQRRGEVAGMRWSEIAADGMWTIPGGKDGRVKNGKTHKVPLPPLALQILANVPRNPGADLVFTNDGRTLGNWSSKKSELDRAVGKIESWVLHDLRRSFVTGMAELGVRPDVIELAVNHRSGMRGGIAGVYNRSELMPQRRAAMELWANHIEELAAGRSNVVAFVR